jgi:hypothetical protein
MPSSGKFDDHDSADLYSSAPATGTACHEVQMFNQGTDTTAAPPGPCTGVPRTRGFPWHIENGVD